MNEEKKDVLKVVLDTNILLSALFWYHGNPRLTFHKIVDGSIKAYTCKELFYELQGVIDRDFNEYAEDNYKRLAFVLSYIEQVELSYDVDAVKDDPDDNMVINCALSAGADYIVSGDKHLLNLKDYNGIKIVSAREFLDILEA